MGKWIKMLRKYRHLDLISSVAIIIFTIAVISALWGRIIAIQPRQLPEGYLEYYPVEAVRGLLSPIPVIMLGIFLLGIFAGFGLASYLILELTKET